jgi:hypothetical protein
VITAFPGRELGTAQAGSAQKRARQRKNRYTAENI